MPGVGSFLGLSRTSGIQGGVFDLEEQRFLILQNKWSGIVSSGLVLNLDILNYPGSGSTWTDSAQGLQFSSVNTQTPYQTVGGSPAFAFNGSGYWRYNANPSLVPMGGDTTLVMWIYGYDVGTRKTVFEKAGTSYQSYEQEIAITWEPDESWTWYSRYNNYDYGATPVSFATVNGWSMLSIKMSTGLTNGVSRTGFYSKNGAAYTSNYTVRSTTPITTAGEVRIGTGYAGTIDSGAVAMVLVYNKMLTDAEILQNYNATRTRFGL